MFLKIGILKSFANFTGKNTCAESLFDKVAGQKAFNFIKERLQRRCFRVKFAKVFNNTFFNRKLLVATSVFIPVCPSKEDSRHCDVIIICDSTPLLD